MLIENKNVKIPFNKISRYYAHVALEVRYVLEYCCSWLYPQKRNVIPITSSAGQTKMLTDMHAWYCIILLCIHCMVCMYVVYMPTTHECDMTDLLHRSTTIALYCIILHYIALYCIILHYIALWPSHACTWWQLHMSVTWHE